MKKSFKIIFILVIALTCFVPSYTVQAEKNTITVDDQDRDFITGNDNKNKDTSGDNGDCKYIFGDPRKEESVAYMMQKVLNYAKILAPLLVLVLSGIDFTKNALTGDQEDMKKATKKLGIRLLCALGVFLAPYLTGFLLNFINNSSVDQTCNIK